jgi:hypothetical protein
MLGNYHISHQNPLGYLDSSYYLGFLLLVAWKKLLIYLLIISYYYFLKI